MKKLLALGILVAIPLGFSAFTLYGDGGLRHLLLFWGLILGAVITGIIVVWAIEVLKGS